MSTPVLFTAKKGKQVVELRQQGLLWTEIAEKLNTTPTTIRRWAVKAARMNSTKGNGDAAKSNGMSAEPVPKKELVRAWLAKNPDGNVAQFCDETSISVHPTYFNTLKRKITNKKSARRTRSVDKQGPKTRSARGKKKTFSKAVRLTVNALEEENEYLKWWNRGERKGWVDRLLKAIQE